MRDDFSTSRFRKAFPAVLIEALHYLLTPVSPVLRRFGYLRESVLLLSRSRRRRSAWASHLAEARAMVERACAGLPRYRTVLILGSGILDDVPLAHLSERFERVVLVDIVHLWPARLAARRHANVVMKVADLSGCVDWLEGKGKRDRDPLRTLGGGDVDFVVSANILSQLPILPLDWFESRGRPVPDDLGRAIVAAHLEGLRALRARVCLMTDVEQVTQDRNGHVVERLDLLHGMTLPAPDRAWTWDIAPFGEIGRGLRQHHRVQAYADWHSASAGEAPSTREKPPR